MVPENIVLLHLPPSGPELNSVENVWDYLRRNKLCALVWEGYDDIVEARKNRLKLAFADPARIVSIGSCN